MCEMAFGCDHTNHSFSAIDTSFSLFGLRFISLHLATICADRSIKTMLHVLELAHDYITI